MLVAIIFAKIIPCYLPCSDSDTSFLQATPGTSGGLRVVHVPALLPAGLKPECSWAEFTEEKMAQEDSRVRLQLMGSTLPEERERQR